MPTMELASPLPSSSSFHRYEFYKFTFHKPITDAVGLIQHTISATAPVAKQPTQKPKRKSQGNNANGLSGKRGLDDSNTYASLLQRCTNLKQVMQVHAHMLRRGTVQNAFIGTKLVCLYSMYGSMANARLVFEKLPKRNVFLWNAIIRGYAGNGTSEEALTLYYRMQQEGVEPNNFTFPFVLKACAAMSALERGKEIHEHIVRTGFESDPFVGTALIDMYTKSRCLESARQLFDKMSKRGLVTWNAMIGGYAQSGHAKEALRLFGEMQRADMNPSSVTIVNVLSACAHLADLRQGKQIHDFVIREGFESNVFVRTALINMYTKCGSSEIARRVFDQMSEGNVALWNAMIAGYAQNGHANEALTLFQQMQLTGKVPDSMTMVSVVQACAHLGALQQGKWIHDYIIQNGLEADVFVMNSLVAMYAKCGTIEIARQLFDNMPKRNRVSWNAMIAGYAQNEQATEAVALFHQMQLTDVTPDSATMLSVLLACTHLASLQQGKWIHAYIIRRGLEGHVFVVNSLIDMYNKCGSTDIARLLFDKMAERDVVTWNAMIAGYGMHGHGEDALALFSQMQHTGMKPDDITFVCILSACSHAGLVNEGWQCFDSMGQYYCITPKVEHYACMIDLMGRVGHLDEALNFIEKMPVQPSASVWGALLGACRIHCNTELGERVAKQLFVLEPKNHGYYVLLSNIYAAAGRWDDVACVRAMMKERGLKKPPGCSMIEVNNRVHAFLVGDRSHPQSTKIYTTLESLAGQMREAGYQPNTNFVLHDVEEKVKENILLSHSEKLAIAFGLINTSSGTPIRITKNLRVCDDCHIATKFISKIVRREIIVRDANRFHHFKDGLCSCGDYW